MNRQALSDTPRNSRDTQCDHIRCATARRMAMPLGFGSGDTSAQEERPLSESRHPPFLHSHCVSTTLKYVDLVLTQKR